MYLLAIVIFEFSVSKYICMVIFRNIYGVRDSFRNFCISKIVITRKPLFVPLSFCDFGIRTSKSVYMVILKKIYGVREYRCECECHATKHSANIDGECEYEYHAIIHTLVPLTFDFAQDCTLYAVAHTRGGGTRARAPPLAISGVYGRRKKEEDKK